PRFKSSRARCSVLTLLARSHASRQPSMPRAGARPHPNGGRSRDGECSGWMSNVASGIRRASAASAGPSVSKSATTTSGCSTSRIGMNARVMSSESSYGRRRSCVLPTMDAERAKRYRTLWEDELAGATLYRTLAESADERRRPILLALAEAEEKHADHWAKMLSDAGFPDLKKPRLPFRVKALSFLAR